MQYRRIDFYIQWLCIADVRMDGEGSEHGQYGYNTQTISQQLLSYCLPPTLKRPIPLNLCYESFYKTKMFIH